jgi:putative ABC transport system permease protein
MPRIAGAIDVAGAKYLMVLARLRADVALEAARARLNVITAAIPDNEGWAADLVPLQQQVTGDMRHPLLLLFAGVVAVLLIACANVSNLLLTRAPLRIRAVAIRSAIGASRARLMRQFTTEALVLCVLAAAFGMVLAFWGRDAVLALSPATLPRRHAVDLDAGVFAFAGALVLVCMIAVGLAPALLGTRVALMETLRGAADTVTGARRRRGTRRTLLVAEIVLTVILLCAATLLVRSFTTILATDPGFRPERITTFGVWLPPHRYAGPPSGYARRRRSLKACKTPPVYNMSRPRTTCRSVAAS